MASSIPKSAATRRRGNRQVGARTLMAVDGLKVPALPETREVRRGDETIKLPWREEAREWWWNVWTSPMAPEYDESDFDELLILAVLVDEFWRDPTTTKAAEIRLQRQCFGLTPIDRRRLQWETDRGDEAETRRKQREAKARPRAVGGKDPRKQLA